MSGLVGKSNIRSDIQTGIQSKIPNGNDLDLSEKATYKVDSVYPFERARTTEVRSLFQFYELLKKVLEFATENDGTSYPIRFTLEYPPSDISLPCFTTQLISRRPLNLKGTKEMAPRFMQEYQDPDYPGEILQEFLVRQYNTIDVTVWAKTNKVVQEMSDWLEDVFWQYLWALQWGGISHPVEWLGRSNDKYEQIREQQIYSTSTTFSVITGKITKKRVTRLRKLAISLGLLIEN